MIGAFPCAAKDSGANPADQTTPNRHAELGDAGGRKGEAERTFSCTVCDKTFKKEQYLQQHVRTHEAKKWECPVCHKLFTTKEYLRKHSRLHTGMVIVTPSHLCSWSNVNWRINLWMSWYRWIVRLSFIDRFVLNTLKKQSSLLYCVRIRIRQINPFPFWFWLVEKWNQPPFY